MKKMLFVFNPNSGKAQIKNQLMKIIQVFSDSGYEVTVYPTKAPMDGDQHIVDSEGRYDVIACSGGQLRMLRILLFRLSESRRRMHSTENITRRLRNSLQELSRE